jgi:23S rRNA-intervening sequence protein
LAIGNWQQAKETTGNRQKAIGNNQANKMAFKSVKETTVYKTAFELAMDIFKIYQTFTAEEKYSLTDQIRRSLRTICICLLKLIGRKNTWHIL